VETRNSREKEGLGGGGGGPSAARVYEAVKKIKILGIADQKQTRKKGLSGVRETCAISNYSCEPRRLNFYGGKTGIELAHAASDA